MLPSAISSEIVTQELCETLMRAVEHSGADRGLLIVERAGQYRIEAEATVEPAGLDVQMRGRPPTNADLPLSILHYASRTRTSILLDDARRRSLFPTDEYLLRRRPRSVFCLPLVNQARLVGVVYLENSLTPNVFTPERVALLELLASRAAISLENREEEAVRASEWRWRALFETASVGVALIGPDQHFVAANAVYQAMVGYSEEELRKLTPLDLAHEDDRVLTDAQLAALAKGVPSGTHEKRYRRKDGTVIWVQVSTSTLPAEEGGPPLFAAVVVDITERKRAEEELRRSETFLAEAQRIAHTGSWRADFSKGEYYFSKETLRIWGLDPDMPQPCRREVLDPILFAMIHPEDRPKVDEVVEAWKAGKAFDLEYRYIMPDGTLKWVHDVSLSPEPASAGAERSGTITDITERKRAEEVLQRSEKRFRALIEQSAEGVILVDGNGKPIYASPSTTRVLGYTPAEFASLSPFDLIHPDDVERGREILGQVREKPGKLIQNQHRVRHKDGSWRWIEDDTRNLLDEPGVEAFVSSFRDITQRKQAEEELRRSEMFLKEAQKISHTGSWRVNLASGDYYFSQEMLRIYGLDPEMPQPCRAEVMNPFFFKLVHPEDRLRVDSAVEAWIAGGAFDLEYRFVMADGTVKHVHDVSLPAERSAGPERSGTITDITERKRAEEALQRSEKRFRALIEHSADAIVLISGEGTVLYASPSVQGIFGYEPDEIVGRDAAQFIRADDPEDDAEILVDVRRSPGKVSHLVRRVMHRNGSRRWIELTLSQLLDEPGVHAIVANMRDVTESKEAEHAVLEARAELARITRVTTLGELVASIAHEVNQPLAAVVTNAEASLRWLGSKSPNLAKVRVGLEQIAEQGARAGDIVARIRGLVRKSPARKEPLELNEAILEVIALTRSEMKNHHVLLETQLSPGLPTVLADRVQVQQVILNLIMNALESMGGSSGPRELWVGSRPAEEAAQVVVEVKDTGRGLDAATVERMFDAFYTTKPEGMGMGLAISRSIVEAHGGKLWASENSPRGAIFTFSLSAERGGA